MTESKRCTRCGVEKPVSEFHQDRSISSGYKSHCKSCAREYVPIPHPERQKFPQLHDEAWLRQKYSVEVLTPKEIAESLGCAPSSVSAALAQYKIQSLPTAFRAVFRERRERGEA
ncbi:MAG: hypothetical protein WC277_04145 [Bacilli bacterium]|jgi:hypothetical protein